MKRIKKLVSLVLCLLLWLNSLPLSAFAAGASDESLVFFDSFDYSGFGQSVDFFGTAAWEAEYYNTSSADDFGYRKSTPPTIANGQLHFKEGDGLRLNWQKLDGFSSFDASKAYTVTFDAVITDTGNHDELDNMTNWNRELYFALAGYYNQIEVRSGNVEPNTPNYGIRAGNTWVGTDAIATDVVYSCSVVWTPANGTVTTTIKSGDTVVVTGSRTHNDFKALNKYTRSWVWRCEDGQMTVDNITFSNGTNTYQQDFNVEAGSMIESGLWGLEDIRVTNPLTPELSGGKLKLSTRSSVRFNWTQVPGVSAYSAAHIYTFEFDLKITDKGNGHMWDGGSYSTRTLYVGFGGWYTLLSMPDLNSDIDVCYGNSKIDWVDAQHLNTDLHATFIWSGNSISGKITDQNGHVLVSGSRQNSAFTDMTIEHAAMTNLVLRCEDGAVEIDHFQFKEEKPRLLGSTELSARPAVYNADIEYGGTGSISVMLGEKALLEITPSILNVCTKRISDHFGAGMYHLHVQINPTQQMVSVEVTAPDGSIVRRAFYQLLEGNDSSHITVNATTDANKLLRSEISYESITPNQYVLAASEPVYSGVAANICNVVTSFDDACTTRNFAWTAKADFVGNAAMALKYRVKGTAEWTVADAVRENEAYTVADEDYFKCDVRGLTADTEYEYKIGIKGSTDEANQWSKIYTFKTPAENVSDFSFIAVGDTQGSSWNELRLTRAAYDEAFEASGSPALILHTGDVVELGGTQRLWNGYFKALGDYAASTPLFATIGNHDTWFTGGTHPTNDGNLYFDYHFNHPNNGGTAVLDMSKLNGVSDPSMLYLAQNADETVYSFNYGDVHFISLNSGAFDNNNDSALLRAQYDWLKADLEANQDAKWTILIQHQPVYHRLGGVNDRGNGIYNDLLETYEVDLVLQGHSHLVTRTYPMKGGQIVTKQISDTIPQGTGTIYTTIGSSSIYHDGLTDGSHVKEMFLVAISEAQQAAYTVIDVKDGNLTLTTRQLNGLILDQFTITGAENQLDCLPGDVDVNGVVDILDALLVLQYTVGWDVTLCEVHADYNEDGLIDVLDALEILRYCVGWNDRKAELILRAMQATLSIDYAKIIHQPAGQSITAGQRAQFTVTASGAGLSYQWYVNRNDHNGWQKLIGATNATYTTAATELSHDGYQYRCVITDVYDSEVVTDSAVLHVVFAHPHTGDTSEPLLYALAMIASGTLWCCFAMKKKAWQ